ncbi:MAG: hypothetical protein ACR2IT_10085 [Pirellulales bacterium]
MPPFLISAILLALLVAAGIGAIVMIRARWLTTPDDQGNWERTLADYKNLREQGVLSEEEYRNIRTLVEPRTRIGAPPLDGRKRPSVDAGSESREELN